MLGFDSAEAAGLGQPKKNCYQEIRAAYRPNSDWANQIDLGCVTMPTLWKTHISRGTPGQLC